MPSDPGFFGNGINGVVSAFDNKCGMVVDPEAKHQPTVVGPEKSVALGLVAVRCSGFCRGADSTRHGWARIPVPDIAGISIPSFGSDCAPSSCPPFGMGRHLRRHRRAPTAGRPGRARDQHCCCASM